MRTFVLRPFIAIFGFLAIIWAIEAFQTYTKGASLADTAKGILSGDRFNPQQIGALQRRLDGAAAGLSESSALWGAAVVRTFLLEEQLKSGNRELSASDYQRLQTNVATALAHSPTDSFMWLTAFWLKRLRSEPAASGLSLLRMSYWSGPNEGWIATKRIPLAFGVFGSLPPDVAEQALSDFAGLVRSGFYWQAAGVLEGPGWEVRQQLISRLRTADLADRRAFARALTEKGIDDLVVPGVEARPARPF